MQIAQNIASYTLEEADILRISMSKKKTLEMIEQKNDFCIRALKNKINKNRAIKIFNLMEKFAGYGFNKSHAASYALISYQSLWLKTKYLLEFICSNISHCIFDTEKLNILIKDSLKNNVFILNININKSNLFFTPIFSKLNKIRYGFYGIKGLGENVIKEILISRKNGFKNIFDFYNKIDKSVINYHVVEVLISSGSFDFYCKDKIKLIKKLNLLFNLYNDKKHSKQKIIFKKNIFINLKKNFFWNFKIKALEEKNVFGFFLLNDLYNIYKKKTNNLLKNKKIINGIINLIF